LLAKCLFLLRCHAAQVTAVRRLGPDAGAEIGPVLRRAGGFACLEIGRRSERASVPTARRLLVGPSEARFVIFVDGLAALIFRLGAVVLVFKIGATTGRPSLLVAVFTRGDTAQARLVLRVRLLVTFA
jgi:hypothetical protein